MIAIFYDNYCGDLIRCKFAGLDHFGRAQWVIITPGYEPMTLSDYVEQEFNGDRKYHFLGMEGETVASRDIAKVLGRAIKNPFDSIETEMKNRLDLMKEMGVKWNSNALNLEIRVFKNEGTQRHGLYSFWVKGLEECDLWLTDVDGFDELEELFGWIQAYLYALEEQAGILVVRKCLVVDIGLIANLDKKYLRLFNEIKRDNIQ